MEDSDESTVRFAVLGRLRASLAGTDLNIGPVQRQVVLAVLLLHANRPLSREQMIEAVWGPDAPTYASNLLQKHVSALRRMLEPGRSGRQPSQLAWTPAGYLLSVPPGALDLQVFDAELERARAARMRGDLGATGEALRAALRQWRGPLCEGLTGPSVDAERDRLAERRLAVVEERLELDLTQGLHADVVEELRGLIVRAPLRERLYELLMTALYRAGRQAEALVVFQQARRLLRDELGIEPAASVQRLHRQILSADPALLLGAAAVPTTVESAPPTAAADTPVPAQLPHGLSYLAGRRMELARLRALLHDDGPDDDPDEADDPPAERVVIAVIDGTAGSGKTALAVHWAHEIKDRYPDGQLYVNLRGFDARGSVMAAADAIRTFLDSFGVSTQQLPATLEAQAALYRSILAGKRVLVILDNARDSEQVRPLLPGAPGCLAVITSRNRLTSLVATEGAQPVTVGLLRVAEARQLLATRIGPARVRAEPTATEEIIRMCARLPLALAIVAARAAIHTQFSLAVLADQLRQTGGLEAFDDNDESTDVRAVFSWSYQILAAPVARVFRLLGLHPGPHLTTASVASTAGMSRRETVRALAELTRANLIEEPVPGRYALHDLLRAYAGELVQELETADERAAAVRRMLDHYLHTASRADRLLDPHQDVPELPTPDPAVTPDGFTECEQALGWFTVEHPVLLGAVDVARAASLHTHTWGLSRTMAVFLHRQGHWYDQITVQGRALEASRRTGDTAAQAYAQCALARAHSQLGHDDEAHGHLRSGLALYAAAGDPIGQAQAYLLLTRVLYRQRRYPEALGAAQEALRLFSDAEHRGGQAAALNAVGWCHSMVGNDAEALEHCRRAVTLHKQLDDDAGMAAALDSLGYIHNRLADRTRAIASYLDAIALWRRIGDRFNEADTFGRLGDTHLAAGDVPAACAAWQDAQSILESLRHPDADDFAAKINKVAGPICA